MWNLIAMKIRGHGTAGLSATAGFAGLWLLVGAGAPKQASRLAEPTAMEAQHQDPCAGRVDRELVITADSIGILDLKRSLAELWRLCPSARDTLFFGEESTSPAVVFHLGGVVAVGMQPFEQLRHSLNPAVPVEVWVVSGSRAKLPSGLSLASHWHELHQALGSGIADLMSSHVSVEFCSLPRVQFELRMLAREAPLGGDIREDLSFIPDRTALRRIWVYPGDYVRSHCANRSNSER